MLVLGLPIFDVVWAIIRRMVKGKSIKAIFKADKGHLHHRLLAKGFSQKQAVLVMYAMSAALGLFAIILLESGIWKALSFALLIRAIFAIGYKDIVRIFGEKSEIKIYEKEMQKIEEDIEKSEDVKKKYRENK